MTKHFSIITKGIGPFSRVICKGIGPAEALIKFVFTHTNVKTYLDPKREEIIAELPE